MPACVDRPVIGPRKELQLALSVLEKKYGKEVVRSGPLSIRRLSTGIAALDAALGGGGFPRGRLSWLRGGGSSGALALSICMLAQISRIAPVALVDFSGECELLDLAAYGGDLDNCWVVTPRRSEEGWAAARAMSRAGLALCLILASEWDRVTAETAPAALQAASREGGTTILLGGGESVPYFLREHISTTVSCRRREWVLAHGDVAGMRFTAQTLRGRSGGEGDGCQLQLNFPRPYAQEVGLFALGTEEQADEGELLWTASGCS